MKTLCEIRGKGKLRVVVDPRPRVVVDPRPFKKVIHRPPRKDWVKKDGKWWIVTRNYSGEPPHTDQWEEGFKGKGV